MDRFIMLSAVLELVIRVHQRHLGGNSEETIKRHSTNEVTLTAVMLISTIYTVFVAITDIEWVNTAMVRTLKLPGFTSTCESY